MVQEPRPRFVEAGAVVSLPRVLQVGQRASLLPGFGRFSSYQILLLLLVGKKSES